jgi:phytoene desaturase
LVLDARRFERFFADFGKKTTDYYELIKLSPAYRVYYGIDDFITIADNLTEIIAALKLSKRCSTAGYGSSQSNYDIAIKDLVYRPAFRHWN